MTTATATKTLLVTGNTYPVKDQIKALGGRWDAAAKGWRVPVAQYERAMGLVNGAGQKAPRSFVSYGSPTRATSRRPSQPCGYPGCRAHVGGHCDECAD